MADKTSRKLVVTEDAPPPVGPYSQAVAVDGLLWVSMQLPLNPVSGELVNSSVAEAARQTLENLKTVVEAGGTLLSTVVKVTVYFKDLSFFAEVNQVYEEYFGTSKPARAALECKLPKGALVAMDAVAMLPPR